MKKLTLLLLFALCLAPLQAAEQGIKNGRFSGTFNAAPTGGTFDFSNMTVTGLDPNSSDGKTIVASGVPSNDTGANGDVYQRIDTGGIYVKSAGAWALQFTLALSSHTHTLSQIVQSGATTGQVPKWNGTTWAPADDESGGEGGAADGKPIVGSGVPSNGTGNDGDVYQRTNGEIYTKSGGSWTLQLTVSLKSALDAHLADTNNPHTVTKTQVGLGSVENTALSSWAGTNQITTVGTIGTGTWNATAIADGKIATALSGKTYNGLTPTALTVGWSLAGGTTSKTLTLLNTLTLSGTDGSTLNVGAGGTLGTAAFTPTTAYDAAGTGATAAAAVISDTAYDATGWNGVTGIAPSKNAVRDYFESFTSSINGGTPNGSGAKVHWSQLLGVPAGFEDGTDDGGAGSDDQTAEEVPFTPAGTIAADDVQAAIEELDTEKAPKASPTFTGTVEGPAFSATSTGGGPAFAYEVSYAGNLIGMRSYNVSTNSAALSSSFLAGNALSNGGLMAEVFGTSFTTSGLRLQDGASLTSGSALSGGLVIGTIANAPLIFAQNNAEMVRLSSAGITLASNATLTNSGAFAGTKHFSFFVNGSSNTGAETIMVLGGNENGAGLLVANVLGTNYASSGLRQQDSASLMTYSDLLGGLVVGTQGSAPLIFATNNTEVGRIEPDGDVVVDEDLAVGGTLTIAGGTVAVANTKALTVTESVTLNRQSSTGLPVEFLVAASDETTAITTGTAKVTFRAPYAFTVTEVRASLTTASSSGTPTVDINEGGTTILSTKLTIDASEKTSTTAATAAVISDTSIADDAEITFDIDTAGTGATGLKVLVKGYR